MRRSARPHRFALLPLLLAAGACSDDTGLRSASRHAAGPREPDARESAPAGAPFELHSDLPLPLELLSDCGVQALEDAYAAMGLARSTRPLPVDAWFCESQAALLEVERRNGFASAYGYSDSEATERTFSTRGGYYQPLRMIALIATPQQDIRVTFAHELVHHAFQSVTSTVCDPLDEGFAMFLSCRSVLAPELEGEGADVISASYVQSLRDDRERGIVPALDSLFELDYWQFRSDEDGMRNFALSWSLVHFLATTERVRYRGAWPRVVAALRPGEPGLRALQRIAPLRKLEADWLEHVDELLDRCPLEPLWGEFYFTRDGVIGLCESVGYVVAIAARGSRWESARSIEARLPASLDPCVSAGFVLDYRSPDEFVLVIPRPEESSVHVVEHGIEGFGETMTVPLAPDFDPAASLTIDRKDDGRAVLAQSGRVVGELPLDDAPPGRVGIYLERHDAPDDTFVLAQLLFENLTAR